MKLLKKIMALLLFLFLGNNLARANEIVAPEGGFPRMFRVSAYYSPLPHQERYLRGNYDWEMSLNGKGTHGADGTPVYAGMIAAPRNYAFGTQIFLPGIGIGTVHDRGGAIVNAGDRGQKYDRIDVWMGYGDAGLTRALNWGMRTLEGRLYGGEKIAENISFGDITPITLRSLKTTNDPKSSLESLGYISKNTQEAILAFQLEYGVIKSTNDEGAGTFGPKTKATIVAALESQKKQVAHFHSLLPAGISRGSTGKNVGILQQFFGLKQTDIFDEALEKKVLAFQVKHKIVVNENSGGAGVFGPKTQKQFLLLLAKREKEKKDAIRSLSLSGDSAPKEKKKEKKIPTGNLAMHTSVAESSTESFSTKKAVAGLGEEKGKILRMRVE